MDIDFTQVILDGIIPFEVSLCGVTCNASYTVETLHYIEKFSKSSVGEKKEVDFLLFQLSIGWKNMQEANRAFRWLELVNISRHIDESVLKVERRSLGIFVIIFTWGKTHIVITW